jgi:hypothetical protein
MISATSSSVTMGGITHRRDFVANAGIGEFLGKSGVP